LNMPDPEDPEDAEKSEYQIRNFHELLNSELKDIGTGLGLWYLIVLPPRHGKTQFIKGAIAHLAGRKPWLDQIYATYNQPFADENGAEVRALLTSRATRQVFPEFNFRDNRKNPAPNHMVTYKDGNLYFVGRGGSITGRGGNVLWPDDLFKDDEEAESQTIRDLTWKWLTRTFLTRRMDEGADVVMVGTRWNEDDPVGRLTDPENKHFNADIFKRLRIIHLSAVAGMYGAPDNDPIGRQPGDVLWQERFSRKFFEQARAVDPVGFAKLYQGVPTASDGVYFTQDMIRLYKPNERPDISSLRIYAASDHAVSVKQTADFTVLLIVGVDSAGIIWVLDCVWRRMRSDETVEEMMRLMKQWRPIIWWAEADHIGKSIGPFLNKRMMEEQTYINVRESPIGNKDLVQRSQPLQGLMRLGRFRIPADAPYREKAVNELLKFSGSSANKDDFVSAAAHIGRAMETLVGGTVVRAVRAAKEGTMGWFKQQDRRERRRAATEDYRRSV
ncbi:MAG: hypothetical protein E6R03_12500, partial [Hyphomicrobiaceae bacterium]